MKKCGIVELLMMGAILITCITGCSSGDETKNNTSPLVQNQRSYDADGICYIENGIAHFTEAMTGKDVTLCSKPNCAHKDKNCSAYEGSQCENIFLWGDSLYRITAKDDESFLFDKVLIKSDVDGSNRKEIAKMENAQILGDVAAEGNMLAVCFINNMDREIRNDVAEGSGVYTYEQPEKRWAGIYLIDMNTGICSPIDIIEEYSAFCYNCVFSGDKLYYCMYWHDEYLNLPDNTDEEYFKKVEELRIQRIYEYDIKNCSKRVIWEGKNEFITRPGEDYILVFDRKGGNVSLLKEGAVIKEYSEAEIRMDDYKSEYMNLYVCDGYLVAMDDKRVWSVNLETGRKEYVGNGRLNESGLNCIEAVTESWVYCRVTSESASYIGRIDRDSFFAGDISKMMALLGNGI